MTLFKENSTTREHPHLLLENFEDLTQSITCTGQNILIKFNSAEVMDHAIKSWDWVNQEKEDYFYLITHHQHQGCGPDEERAPQKITAIKYNKGPNSLTATLTRESVSWDEAAQNFDFAISNSDSAAIRRLTRRESDIALPPAKKLSWGCLNFVDWSTHGGDRCFMVEPELANQDSDTAVMKAVQKLPDFDETNYDNYAYEWPRPTNQTEVTLVNDPFKSDDGDKFLVVKCTECQLKGSFALETYAQRRDGQQTQLKAKLQPNFSGSLVTNVKFQPNVAEPLLQKDVYTQKLPELSIPISPIAIPGLFTVGPEFVVAPELEAKIKGTMEVDIGFKLATGQASLTFDFQNEDSLVPENWDTIKPEIVFTPKVGTLEVSITPALDVGFRLGVSILAGRVKIGAFAGVKASASNTITFGGDSAGFCQDDPTHPTTGAKMQGEFKIEAGIRNGFEFNGESLWTMLIPNWDLKKTIVGPFKTPELCHGTNNNTPDGVGGDLFTRYKRT
ncbi:hypothetical protein ABW20_dc0107569 [Dactylellina cionopaga]|nr:hypothetical protein ABW20_dc0107569 [Dactylellina cionopaga]